MSDSNSTATSSSASPIHQWAKRMGHGSVKGTRLRKVPGPTNCRDADLETATWEMVRLSPPSFTTGFLYSATMRFTSSKWLPLLGNPVALGSLCKDESGFWRPKPDGTIEVVISQSTAEEKVIKLQSELVGNASKVIGLMNLLQLSSRFHYGPMRILEDANKMTQDLKILDDDIDMRAGSLSGTILVYKRSDLKILDP
ncbi:hypothetical protein L3X38_031331 [Prunus dulcis]|uniref:Uncharacterized protein n=1 Tax=Prunus dulcis TaxID=3755 RepID=A0AAD4VBW9_PRUDU|nr:hypothetical protein L3X38_031331 [Prunus dulcis]